MKVLIATDGSDTAVHAARRGLELLDDPSAVTLLTVLTEIPGDDAGGFEGSVYTPEEQDRMWRAEQAEANAELDRTAAALPAGIEVERRVEVGDVAAAIVDVAAETGADVVVLGSHGRGFLGRVLLGSVSEHVVRHAPCPVLVVRPAPEPES